jgi:anti-sigma factor RsiW
MNNETETLSEADEIAALLPWYVTGKISAADRARIEAYAETHPEISKQIAVAREEADTIFAANAEVEAPHRALDTLKASLAASPGARLSSVRSSLVDRIGEFLASLAPRQLVYAGITAALAFAILGGTVGSMFSSGPGYEVASGPGTSANKGTFALVAFQPAAPAATLSAFLADNKYSIIDGPRPGGMYRLRLSEEVLSEAARLDALAKIKARADLVSFVSAAPDNK